MGKNQEEKNEAFLVIGFDMDFEFLWYTLLDVERQVELVFFL